MDKIIRNMSPYYDERPGTSINSIVLHCSTYSAKDMIDVLLSNRLSSHYIIGERGEVYQLVEDEKRAWHAGVSKWRDMENLNHYSIGIELSSFSMGQSEYTVSQIDSLIKLCERLKRQYKIPQRNIIGHSDVAPTRKADPGVYFPWKYLAEQGIGLWYDINDAEKIRENDVSVLLQKIGYDTEDLSAAAYAFCRHFVTDEVDVIEDVYKLVEEVYRKDFIFPEKYIAILKACVYQYDAI